SSRPKMSFLPFPSFRLPIDALSFLADAPLFSEPPRDGTALGETSMDTLRHPHSRVEGNIILTQLLAAQSRSTVRLWVPHPWGSVPVRSRWRRARAKATAALGNRRVAKAANIPQAGSKLGILALESPAARNAVNACVAGKSFATD